MLSNELAETKIEGSALPDPTTMLSTLVSAIGSPGFVSLSLFARRKCISSDGSIALLTDKTV